MGGRPAGRLQTEGKEGLGRRGKARKAPRRPALGSPWRRAPSGRSTRGAYLAAAAAAAAAAAPRRRQRQSLAAPCRREGAREGASSPTSPQRKGRSNFAFGLKAKGWKCLSVSPRKGLGGGHSGAEDGVGRAREVGVLVAAAGARAEASEAQPRGVNQGSSSSSRSPVATGAAGKQSELLLKSRPLS